MCGIAGILEDRGLAERSTLEPMIDSLRHRGPDGVGLFTDGPVGLAHARLSIIDLAGGQQPMCNEDGSLWITCNGEIFNHVELRQYLVSKGHLFSTRSDTEVILHLYEEEGEACVHRLNGQWAFALWDARKHQLMLSRDRVGILPLFYARVDGAFLWSSEIKGLFAHPGLDRSLDLVALDQIFTFWVPLPPRSIFRDVRQIPPGCSARIAAGDIHVYEYWKHDFSGATPSTVSEEELAEQLLYLLNDATRIRLRSDVPVACYLSGGIDSSLITALAKNSHSGTLSSFSVTFDRPDLDERIYQDAVSAFLGTDHQSVHASDEQLTTVFPDVIRHAEMPLLRTAPAPLYLLSQLVQQNEFRVVLTGEGSDEILGGYDIFKESKIRQFWAAQPDSSRRPLLLKRLYPYMPRIRPQSAASLQRFFKPVDRNNPFDSHAPRWELTSGLKLLFSDRVKDELSAIDATTAMRESMPEEYFAWGALHRAQYLEARFLLPGYILSSQGDRMAMAHGVEARHPLLDHRVVEFASRLPATMKLKVLNEKYLLKKIASRFLPAEVVRRPKQPFRAPDGTSFFAGSMKEYVLDALSPHAIKELGLFDSQRVTTLVKKFLRKEASSVRDNMALVGVLSTQMLVRLLATPISAKPTSMNAVAVRTAFTPDARPKQVA